MLAQTVDFSLFFVLPLCGRMEINMYELISILSEICPGIDFDNEDALVDDGLIDSFDIVAIVTELKDYYDIDINVEDLLPENFNSAEAIWELVKSRRDK